MHSTAEETSKKRGATANASRLLFLFSALTVLVFTRDLPIHTGVKLAALLVVTVASGVALLGPIAVHEIAVRDLARLRRAEWALVFVSLVVGLVLTAGVLAQSLAALGSPLWYTLIGLYAILGLAAAAPLSRRLPLRCWAFPLFLMVHAAMTVALLRVSPSHIDVQVFLHDGAGALLHGHNPYSMTFPNIYRSPFTEMFYGPGVVIDGRVTYGFPYLPVSLLVAIPGQLLGDVRYSQLIAMLLTAAVLRKLASDGIGRAAAVLGVASMSAMYLLVGSWTDPSVVALLACLVLALERRRQALVAVFLGLFFVSKQFVVVAIPIIWLLRQSLTRSAIFIGLGVASAVTLPFFVIDPAAFWKAIVEFQLLQPFRSDSLSLLVFSVTSFAWPPPWTYGILPLLGGGLTAFTLTRRAPRTPAAFAAAVGLTLLVTILLSKQGIMNYYFVVSGAFLIAAVAWPRPSEPSGPTSSAVETV